MIWEIPRDVALAWELSGRDEPWLFAQRLAEKSGHPVSERLARNMGRMAAHEIAKDGPVRPPTTDELAVLLSSSHPEIRLLGIRLSWHSRDPLG